MTEAPVLRAPAGGARRGLLIIPCFNEELSLPRLLAEVDSVRPGLDTLVINDGSSDHTCEVARAHAVRLLDLPCNLGVAHAVQTGFQYALEHGYDFVVRIDGDGQHPPAEIPKLLRRAEETGADLVIGSRFGQPHEVISTRFRYLGIRVLALFLSRICRARVTDPTSGFWLIQRDLLTYFAHEFPTDYPEPEAIALLRRQGYSFAEAPVTFRARQAGVSSIQSWGTLYYALKVGLALLVDRVRPVNRHYARRVRA